MNLIENTKLKVNQGVVCADSFTTVANKQTAIDYSQKDDGRILILLNSASGDKTITVLKGNALQGTSDMEVTVAGGKETGLVVESGKFVNGEGEMKGKLIIEGDAGVEIRVIELP